MRLNPRRSRPFSSVDIAFVISGLKESSVRRRSDARTRRRSGVIIRGDLIWTDRDQLTDELIPLSHRFSEALGGAADLHARQFRKGTTIPYVAHLLGVASIALHHGADEDEAIAALLHDAIEDAPADPGASWVRDWIRFRFGERVLRIVEGCTDADVSPKPKWQPRKEAYISRVRKELPSVVLVSAADKLHNASAILSDYREVKDRLWERFNKDAGKAGVIGYYRGLVVAYRATGYHPRTGART
jgi:(p)ppGpp synthase/HD superfamily hydrolase